MTQKVWSFAVGLLMVLVGMAFVWLTTKSNIGRAAEIAGGTPAANTAPAAILRVAAGRNVPYTDSQGNIWRADEGFEGGAMVIRPELKVTGTNEPGLYCAERYSMDSYSFKVPNGTYMVKLHFCEGYEANKSPDDRLFTFDVQGQTFKDFSPWKKAGAQFKAYVETIKDVKVADGQLKITFTQQLQLATINAIEIYPADAVAAVPDIATKPAVAAAGVTASKAILRIAAGRDTPYKDSQGNIWEADRGFEGGTVLDRPDVQVTGTTEPGLYCAERYGMDSYSFKVPNGTYMVKLHFSENYDGHASPEARIFTFDVQGQKFKEFSPWKKAGAQHKAYIETVKDVKVTDGQLKITFSSQVDNSQINALEIYSTEGSAPDTAVKPAVAAAGATASKAILRIAAGRDADYKDSQGNIWKADTGFEGGSTIDRPDLQVTGTTEPGLYCAEHYGMDAWSWKVPNGSYMVKLHFSEDYDGNASPDDRIFDYAVKDGDAASGKEVKKVTGFSPWKKSGAHSKAYVDSVPISVTKGAITIVFTPNVENPQINAIEIDAADAL